MNKNIAIVLSVVLLFVCFPITVGAVPEVISVSVEPSLDFDESVMFSAFHEGVAVVSKDGKYGLIDSTGTLIIPLLYDRMSHPISRPDLVIATQDGKQGILKTNGEVVIPFDYSRVTVFTYDLAAVKLEDRWGYLNEDGQTEIDFLYEEASSFIDSLALVKLEGKYGFIDPTGELVIEPQYDEAQIFAEGMAWVKKDGLWSAVDNMGELRVAYREFGQAPTPFMSGRSVFSLGPQLGVLDSDGNTVVEAVYNGANFGVRMETLLMAWEGKWGAFDLDGEIAIPFIYDDLSYLTFQDPQGQEVVCYLAEKDDRWGVLDATGQESVAFQYDMLFYAQEGLFKAHVDNDWLLINHVGEVVATLDFDFSDDTRELRMQMMLEGFSGGYAPVSKNGKYGFINQHGKLIVPLQYDAASFFSDGLCWVKLDGKYGILQINVEELSPADEATPQKPPEQSDAERPQDLPAIVMTIDSKKVVRGDDLLIEPLRAPCVIGDRIMLPFRYLVETLLEGEVSFEAASQTIEATIDGSRVSLTLGVDEIIINDEVHTVDRLPHVQDGVTLVSITVFEHIVSEIVWDSVAQTITITP